MYKNEFIYIYENCAAHTFSVQRIVRLMTKWFSSLYAGDKSYSIFQMINLFTFHFLCALPYPAIFISFTHSCQFGERDAIHISVCVCVPSWFVVVVNLRSGEFNGMPVDRKRQRNQQMLSHDFPLTVLPSTQRQREKNEKIVKMSQCVFTASFARAICHGKSCVWVWQSVGTQKERYSKRETERERDVHQPTTI